MSAQETAYAEALRDRLLIDVDGIDQQKPKSDVERIFRNEFGFGSNSTVYWPRPLEADPDRHHAGWCHVAFTDRRTARTILIRLNDSHKGWGPMRVTEVLEPITFFDHSTTEGEAEERGRNTSSEASQGAGTNRSPLSAAMEHMATQSSVLLRQSRDPAAAWTEYRVFRPHGAVTEDSILLMAKDDMTVLIEIKILGPGNGNGDD